MKTAPGLELNDPACNVPSVTRTDAPAPTIAVEKRATPGIHAVGALECGSPQDVKLAVALAKRLMQGPGHYEAKAACEQALRAYPGLKFSSGWRGLNHQVALRSPHAASH